METFNSTFPAAAYRLVESISTAPGDSNEVLVSACRGPVRLPVPVELPMLAERVQWHRFQDNDPCHTRMRTLMLEVAHEMAPLPAG